MQIMKRYITHHVAISIITVLSIVGCNTVEVNSSKQTTVRVIGLNIGRAFHGHTENEAQQCSTTFVGLRRWFVQQALQAKDEVDATVFSLQEVDVFTKHNPGLHMPWYYADRLAKATSNENWKFEFLSSFSPCYGGVDPITDGKFNTCYRCRGGKEARPIGCAIDPTHALCGECLAQSVPSGFHASPRGIYQPNGIARPEWGVALLSNTPIYKRAELRLPWYDTGDLDDCWETSRLDKGKNPLAVLAGKISVNGHRVWVINTYLSTTASEAAEEGWVALAVCRT